VQRWLLRGMGALAGLYLAAVWLDGAGFAGAIKWIPLPARFFVQVAQLFPHAEPFAIEWRAQGYRCAAGTVEEIDLRPHFPIHADDKENRFNRAMFFFHRNRAVLEALDAFISQREEKLGPDHRLGGVTLLSVRVPIPSPGEQTPRYRRVSLEEMPAEYKRRVWYASSRDDIDRRCAESP
jgi:hypothetical protein